MNESGITAKDVQKYLGLGCVQSVYRWLEGISMPTIDNLYALNALFQVPIDMIVCGNRRIIVLVIAETANNSRERRLLAYYQKLQELPAA